MSTKNIYHNGRLLIPNAKWCATFASKFRGFMLHAPITPAEALVLVEKRENKLNTAIHMLFMRFDLGVVWVNGRGQVVDKTLAKRWRLQYSPTAPAQYVIEMHPSLLEVVQVGDGIEFR
ncbi:MAG: DUF192 domain-containing protein [Chloroflexi bacterium]|nr:DUF192 domain-containing protein [Chloroflexota bacterium]